MASSDRTPTGLRRSDPDETEGRLLYRQRAIAEARMQMALTRGVRLTAAREQREHSSQPGTEPKAKYREEHDD